MHPYRSVLFVPAHKPDWAQKALASGADCIVIDLEDSVPADLKAPARVQARETIERLRAESADVGLFVRANPLESGRTGADLAAVVCPELTGLFVPKVRTARDIVRWEALIECFEGLNGGSDLSMIVPVETVEAIVHCEEIATASPRVGAMIGPTSEHADIARAVGFRQSPEGSETLYLRSRILIACRYAGIHPLTALWEDLGDLDGLRTFADYGLQLGFRGMILIHPSHVGPVHEVFTPSDDDVAHYEGLVAAVEQGLAEGHGAVRYNGAHVDIAHLEKARDWLENARLVRRETTPNS